MPLKLVLMGTGEFAVPPFRALMDSEHTVVGVLTQPEKTGRGHHQHVNPVKEMAAARAVPVFQPERVNRPEMLETLRSLQADAFIVAAYGQILKPELLAIPELGAFNLHGSLLPRHRGAAPVQYSIWKGDTITGVTIFQIEPAIEKCGKPFVARISYSQVARAHIMASPDGMLKMIADSEGRKLLGIQVAGDGATELVHLGQMAMLGDLPVDTFVHATFNFPTMAEAYRLAALEIIHAREFAGPLVPGPDRQATTALATC